jgi:hypothetical protein
MEEPKLRVFEKRVLRRIFGPKTNEVTGGWRKLHKEKLRGLYSAPIIIRIIKSRKIRLAGNTARMIEKRTEYSFLIGNLVRKGPLGRPRRW